MVSIDGKTLRRSFDRAAGKCALHVVTAFAGIARVALGQNAGPEGGNQITAARALLELQDLKVCLAPQMPSIASARWQGSSLSAAATISLPSEE